MRSVDARALYHAASAGRAAWIEIFVDRVLDGAPWVSQRLPFLRDLLLAPVLYHEVGHHIERVRGRKGPAGEDVAEAWSKKLMASFVRRRYWYAMPIIKVVDVLSRNLR
jgi:hypothetical protein